MCLHIDDLSARRAALFGSRIFMDHGREGRSPDGQVILAAVVRVKGSGQDVLLHSASFCVALYIGSAVNSRCGDSIMIDKGKV